MQLAELYRTRWPVLDIRRVIAVIRFGPTLRRRLAGEEGNIDTRRENSRCLAFVELSWPALLSPRLVLLRSHLLFLDCTRSNRFTHQHLSSSHKISLARQIEATIAARVCGISSRGKLGTRIGYSLARQDRSQIYDGISTESPAIIKRDCARFRETEYARQGESESRFRGQRLSPGVCRLSALIPSLKGQVILQPSDEFIGNLRRGTRDAKDLLFRLNPTVRTRGWRGRNPGGRVERLSTPERSKPRRFVISKGCSLMDFLFGLNLKSSAASAGLACQRAGGSPWDWHYRFTRI